MFQQIISLVSGAKAAKNSDKGNDVSFCENCGEVCGPTCRSEAFLNQAKEKFTSYQSGLTGRY